MTGVSKTHNERDVTAKILAIWSTLSSQQKKKMLASFHAHFPDLKKAESSSRNGKRQIRTEFLRPKGGNK